MRRKLTLCLLLLAGLTSFGMERDSLAHLPFSWTCQGEYKECELDVPMQLIDYYRNSREHLSYRYTVFDQNSRGDAEDIFGFVFSEYHRDFIRELAGQMRDSASSDYECAMAALTFVQSLPYSFDVDSKGRQEYVRYPLETLADGEGDCEDKTILLAALLDAMGFEYLLLQLPEHKAIGIHCEVPDPESTLRFEDKDYYFMETTQPGWEIGQVPKPFQNISIEVRVPSQTPLLLVREVKFNSDPAFVMEPANCRLELNLGNQGPGRITGLELRIQVIESRRRGDKVVKEEQLFLEDLLEGEQRTQTLEFKSVVNKNSWVRISLTGDQITPQEIQLKN